MFSSFPSSANKPLVLRLSQCTLGALLYLSFLPPLIANANEPVYEPHIEIYRRAHLFIGDYLTKHHVGESRIELGRLDQRLQLRKCTQGVTFKLTPLPIRARAVTLETACRGVHPWKVYIPSQIYLYKPVAIAKTNLRRGQVLSSNDIGQLNQEVTNLPYGYYAESTPLEGKLATRLILAGTVITPPMLSDPLSVQRGQTVTLIADVAGAQVRMNGRALASGSQGHLIRVMNLSSGRIVEGIIVQPGVVQVNL